MTDTISHRGPDDEGFYVAPGVELGMRRLSIIDVVGGHQPIWNESKSVVVVFNGEIYNFQELRDRLVAGGHAFSTASDTEVIVHLYEDLGANLVDELRGMFAFALWDLEKRALLIARDHLGKKPLFYARFPDGSLAFGSETRSVLPAMNSRAPNLEALNFVLAFGYVPAPMNAFEGLEALPPGHVLEWSGGNISVRRYWRPDLSVKVQTPYEDALSVTRSTLEESVRLRLTSERPLGVFLSGGVDSTVVAAMTAQLHDGPVKTFSIGFTDQAYDESRYARAVAAYLGTDHHELMLSGSDLASLDRIGRAFDQPFADSSALPTMALNAFAREHVVVALGGDGGDEAFGGYDRYVAAPRLQRLAPALWAVQPMRRAIERMAVRSGHRRAIRLSQALDHHRTLESRYSGLMQLAKFPVRARLFTEQAAESFSLGRPEKWFEETWLAAHAASDKERMVAVDLETYLPGDLLTKADISSMHSSLELRSPLLDKVVVEQAAALPTEYRIGQGQTKRILRDIARELVPANLIDRPKMGFAIPRAAWLRGSLREPMHDLLLDVTAGQRGWFDRRAVLGEIQMHESGLNRDHILWPLLMIELWAREWID